MSFLLSLKNVESSSFMTDPFCQNFLPLLTRYSSSSFTISAGKEKEKTKFLNIPDITLLIPILYITVSFLSFINVGNGDINSTKGIIRYLGRYLARSPIAEYRITDITDKEVTFFFNDLANDKKKTYITMSSEKFISYILIHLPPKNFKMVNRYGFYSRHIYCPVCKVKMIVWEFYHYRYPPFKKYY